MLAACEHVRRDQRDRAERQQAYGRRRAAGRHQPHGRGQQQHVADEVGDERRRLRAEDTPPMRGPTTPTQVSRATAVATVTASISPARFTIGLADRDRLHRAAPW